MNMEYKLKNIYLFPLEKQLDGFEMSILLHLNILILVPLISLIVAIVITIIIFIDVSIDAFIIFTIF